LPLPPKMTVVVVVPDQQVVTLATIDTVIAFRAIQHVAERIAEERVVADPTDRVLDRDQRVDALRDGKARGEINPDVL
jgi:hypothetical protein